LSTGKGSRNRREGARNFKKNQNDSGETSSISRSSKKEEKNRSKPAGSNENILCRAFKEGQERKKQLGANGRKKAKREQAIDQGAGGKEKKGVALDGAVEESIGYCLEAWDLSRNLKRKVRG